MKQCAKCGAEFEEELLQCPTCGEAMLDVTVTTEHPHEKNAVQGDMRTVNEYPQNPMRRTDTEVIISKVKPQKRKTWLWIVLALTLVLAATAAIWFFFLRAEETETEEEFDLKDAVEECVDQLRDLTENAENLHAFIDTVRDRVDEKKASITVAGTTEESSVDADISAQFNYSADAKIIDGEMLIDIEYGANEASFEVDFALSNEKLQVSAPSLLDDVLEFNISDEEIINKESLEKIDKLITEELAEQLLDELIDSIEIEKETQETILFGEEERNCTIYTVSYDKEIANELLQGIFPGYVEEESLDGIERIRLIVYDEQVVGMFVETTQDETVTNTKILLFGKKNPWSEVRVFADDEEKLYIYTELTDDGFTTEITDIENASEVRIICDDREQTLCMENRSEGSEINFRYQLEDETATLIVERDATESPVTFKISPLEKKPTIISDHATDVEQMSEFEVAMMFLSILEDLKDNPQTTWIYDLITNGEEISIQ